jgi:hypothetical protein
MALDHGTGRRISAAADKRRAVERRAAVKKMNIDPHTRQGVRPEFKEVRCGA